MSDDTGGINLPGDPLVGKEVGYESSLSNWAGDYVTDMLGRGWALADQPYYSYFGPLSAGPSSLQNQAFSGIANLAVPTGSTDAANTAGQIGQDIQGLDYTTGVFGGQRFTDPGVAQSYMNPYLQQALDPQLDELRRQAEISRLNDASRLTKAGAYGGSRQAIMESELNDNMLRLMNETVGKGYRQAYDKAADVFRTDEERLQNLQKMREQSRQFGAGYDLDTARAALDAARLQGQLSTEEFDNALRLLNNQAQLGATERGITQEGIAADKAQFEEERMFPYKQVQFMQSLLQNLPLEAQNTYLGQPSYLSTLLGSSGGIMELFKIFQGETK